MEPLLAAKDFMLAYLSDGDIRQPADFDTDILGTELIIGALEIIRGQQPAWNKTIFCDALGELVEEGKVKAWNDIYGWHYQYIEPKQ